MKALISLSLAALVAQACGHQATISEAELTSSLAATRTPEKNELVEVESTLSLSPAADVEQPKDGAPADASKPAIAMSPDKLSQLKASSALEKPTSARVTFELMPEKNEAAKALSEKIVLEEKFPADVSAAAIESVSKLKLKHSRSYKVVVEQLKDTKVLQTTTLQFDFTKKRNQGIKIATSQTSGVSLRYGKGDKEVMRECPAGQFMSGIGFNEIPICRVVESSISMPAPAKAAEPNAANPADMPKSADAPANQKPSSSVKSQPKDNSKV